MARIEDVDPSKAAPLVQRVFEAQTKKWGGPLLNHLLYARSLPIFLGVRAMWNALDQSGLIETPLQALINRRVAWHNGCVF